MKRVIILSLLSFACTEYDLSQGIDNMGTYNPPELENISQTDRVIQVTVPAVDVLWVIDNSCSMDDEQTALAQNFEYFISYFAGSGMDYHIGVVSTDMDSFSSSHQGKLQGMPQTYIDSSMSEAEAIASFQQRARLGTTGSGDERGRDAAYAALSDPLRSGYNAGFYRPDAFLSVVAVSDEQDHSRNISVNEFISWFQNLKNDEEMLSFNSIVGPRDGSCGAGGLFSDEEPGTEYLDITDAVGGLEWPICSPDWSSVLTDLGVQSAGLKKEFFLSEIPVEDSIEVDVLDPAGAVIEFERGAGAWGYEYVRSRNAISFNEFIPDPLSEVLITYEVLESAQSTITD